MADKEKELTDEELKKAAGGVKLTKADPGQLGTNPQGGGSGPSRERDDDDASRRGR